MGRHNKYRTKTHKNMQFRVNPHENGQKSPVSRQNRPICMHFCIPLCNQALFTMVMRAKCTTQIPVKKRQYANDISSREDLR